MSTVLGIVQEMTGCHHPTAAYCDACKLWQEQFGDAIKLVVKRCRETMKRFVVPFCKCHACEHFKGVDEYLNRDPDWFLDETRGHFVL